MCCSDIIKTKLDIIFIVSLLVFALCGIDWSITYVMGESDFRVDCKLQQRDRLLTQMHQNTTRIYTFSCVCYANILFGG